MRNLSAILVILTLVCSPRRAAGLDNGVLRLRVDPAGASGPGVAPSVEAALEQLRQLPEGTESVEITVASGVHEIRRGLRVQARVPVKIRGELNGEPGGSLGSVLLGGARLRGPMLPVREDDPVWARLPEGARGKVRWVEAGGLGMAGPERRGMGLPARAGSEVFSHGKPMTPARWPDAGFVGIAGVVDAGSSKERPADAPKAGTFRVADKERLARWAGAPGVWLSGYWFWDWADDTMPAGKVDADAGTVTLGAAHTYGLGPKARFAVLNIPEELDAPGEYWIDRTGERVYLVPRRGEEAGGDLWVSLVAEPIILVEGARDVEISDLVLEGGRGAAVVARDVEGLRIERCLIRNTGTTGVELEGRRSVVESCAFEDIGAAGVVVSGGDRATLTHAGNRVLECVFRRCGRTHRTYQPAVRIDGVGQVVSNNLIEDLPHAAIIFAGNEHTIERNEIARVLLETGDAGAIYCGRDWTLHGTVIRHNLFHDIAGSSERYQNAVYLDDMASGITVEGNVMIRCNWGMLIGGGRDVLIRGNVFDSCRKGVVFDRRGVGWMAKAIADPAKSTLHERLRAVPIDREPWRSRYPSLGTYLSDRFGRPVGSSVEGNVFLGTPLGRIDDPECVANLRNTEMKEPLTPEEADAVLVQSNRRGEWTPRGAPEGFRAIPVGSIGPQSTGARRRGGG